MWGLYLNDGSLYSQSGDNQRAYRTPIKNGDEVEVILDSAKRQISFKVNGTNFGVEFKLWYNTYYIVRKTCSPLHIVTNHDGDCDLINSNNFCEKLLSNIKKMK